MFLLRCSLCTRSLFCALLCSLLIYAPNGMEENSLSKAESSSQTSEPLSQTSSTTFTENVVLESTADLEQSVTTKEISASENDLITTPTVAPATPHYDTEILTSSSIVNSVLGNEQSDPNSTADEPEKDDSKSIDREDDTQLLNKVNKASDTTVVQEESNKSKERQPSDDKSEGISPRMDALSNEDTDSITATLKQAEEENVQKEEEMPSFDEFKKKLLEEEQSKIKQKQQQDTQIPRQPPVKQKAKKQKERKKSNYAAIDCGAKILSSNPEASNVMSVLMENRDLYMLNPCSEQIWFIVELCELVQVKTIEIANFELFSSTPESFRVYVSSRFPTREWTMLGTFQARDQRDIQSFPLDEPIYAKYLKVEMLSHFGTQHYCPLSLFRVFGVSMVEEYEDHESSSHDSDTTDNEDEDVIPVLPPDPGVTPEKEEKKSNILEEAANKVLNFVKEAAKKITQVVKISNETLGENDVQNVDKRTKDENKQKIVTLMGKEETEDRVANEQVVKQNLNKSAEQIQETKSPDIIKIDSKNVQKDKIVSAHQLESKINCSFPTLCERFFHSLGDSANCKCTRGKILCIQSHKVTSSRDPEGTNLTFKKEDRIPVVSKIVHKDENETTQKEEKVVQEKSAPMNKEPSSAVDSSNKHTPASSTISSIETKTKSNSESSSIVQSRDIKKTDTEQRTSVNQTEDKVPITTFIQPSKAKETLSRHLGVTLKGNETPHVPLAVTVTVKPGNSSTTARSKLSAETKVTENNHDSVDTLQVSAVVSSVQENNKVNIEISKKTKQQNQESSIEDRASSETINKSKNDFSQSSSISDASKPLQSPSADSKEPGCEVQTDAIATQSSSLSQCSAVNSIEMMTHPVPGVDVLEIKLADGAKEATAHPHKPDSGTGDKQKVSSLDTEQSIPLKDETKAEESNKDSNVTSKLGEDPADTDSASSTSDDTDVKVTENLPSKDSLANKPDSNPDESIPPLPAPPVAVTEDTISSSVSAKPAKPTESSVMSTAVNEERSAPNSNDVVSNIEIPLVTDTNFDTHFTSSIDKIAAQTGSSSVPSMGTGSSGTQKESIFLRLSNKIKALEQNLTLSTRYMEQLNQRYRKSLEEIQKKFDKRINVLTNATKLAEALIKSQKEQITKLQGKQKETNNIVERMAEKMHRLNQEVMERHIVGLFLEIVLIIVVLAILRRRDRARIASLAQTVRANTVINGHGPPRLTANVSKFGSTAAFTDTVASSVPEKDHRPSHVLENIGPVHSGEERDNSKHKVEIHDSISEVSKKKKHRRKTKSPSVSSVTFLDTATNRSEPLENPSPNQASLVSKTAGLLFSPIGFLNGLYSKTTAVNSHIDPCISNDTQVNIRRGSTSNIEIDNPPHRSLMKAKSLEIVPEDNSGVFFPLGKTSKIPCAPPLPPTSAKRLNSSTHSLKKIPSSLLCGLPTKSRGKIRGAGHASIVTG